MWGWGYQKKYKYMNFTKNKKFESFNLIFLII